MTLRTDAPTPVRPDFVPTMEAVVAQYDKAYALAERVISRGLHSVFLVGSGGSHFVAYPAHYILENHAAAFPAFHMTSAELSRRKPAWLTGRSLVVAASHKGTTPETVEAAQVARAAGATVAAIATDGDSPLVAAADVAFQYPSLVTAAEPRTTHFFQIAVALLERAGALANPGETRAALRALPNALRAVKDEVAPVAQRIAEFLAADDPITYVVASGGAFGIAQALAGCYLQEMQWLHAAAIDAGDFVHGPFEMVLKDTPVIFLVGEDASRPIVERAVRFGQRYSDRCAVVDARAFALEGVPTAQRPLVSALALASAARRILDHVAAARGHDTGQRRYMWKVEY